VYSDAKAKAAFLGEFNFFNAWMSQSKSELNTFDSDIRYYSVVASAATEIATSGPAYNCHGDPQTGGHHTNSW
jgi:D-galacturonate reductase